MDLLQWVALWSLIATQVGTAIGTYKYFNNRINRVYERLDIIKTAFVSKDMCKVMHENTSSSLTGTESRISSRFDKLEKRVDDSFNMIIEMLKEKK